MASFAIHTSFLFPIAAMQGHPHPPPPPCAGLHFTINTICVNPKPQMNKIANTAAIAPLPPISKRCLYEEDTSGLCGLNCDSVEHFDQMYKELDEKERHSALPSQAQEQINERQCHLDHFLSWNLYYKPSTWASQVPTTLAHA
jgi:hypothetical protein